MSSNVIPIPVHCEPESGAPVVDRPTARIAEFYDAASVDYLHWSRGFNMHLGYWRWGMDPFDREGMLEQFNQEIAGRLMVDLTLAPLLVDLGCGAGAVARSVARRFPGAIISGVTLSPTQARLADELNRRAELHGRIQIVQADYHALPIEDHSVDAVWAVESACHAPGSSKEEMIREMARVLREGGRFVVADVFVKPTERKRGFLLERVHRTVCDCWELGGFPARDAFLAALARYGFQDLRVENISWRVAPSLAHAPFAVIGFMVKKWWAGERMGKPTRNNLKASLLAIILGLDRAKFSYCLVSGRAGRGLKPEPPAPTCASDA